MDLRFLDSLPPNNLMSNGSSRTFGNPPETFDRSETCVFSFPIYKNLKRHWNPPDPKTPPPGRLLFRSLNVFCLSLPYVEREARRHFLGWKQKRKTTGAPNGDGKDLGDEEEQNMDVVYLSWLVRNAGDATFTVATLLKGLRPSERIGAGRSGNNPVATELFHSLPTAVTRTLANPMLIEFHSNLFWLDRWACRDSRPGAGRCSLAGWAETSRWSPAAAPDDGSRGSCWNGRTSCAGNPSGSPSSGWGIPSSPARYHRHVAANLPPKCKYKNHFHLRLSFFFLFYQRKRKFPVYLRTRVICGRVWLEIDWNDNSPVPLFLPPVGIFIAPFISVMSLQSATSSFLKLISRAYLIISGRLWFIESGWIGYNHPSFSRPSVAESHAE